MIRQFAKSTFYRLMPKMAEQVAIVRQRRRIIDFEASHGVARMARKYLSQNGAVVQSGPFQGMAYLTRAAGSALVPKLLGCYESELHPWIASLCKNAFSQIVDIGCAEGYYAVGLARMIPSSVVVGYEIDPVAARLCAELAKLNGVDARVEVRGKCTVDKLREDLWPNALIFSDCEGFEGELLNPERVPQLASSTMLIEVHEGFRPGVTQLIRDRFSRSHTIEFTSSSPRCVSDYRQLCSMSREEQELAVSEFRHGPEQWAICRPANG
jgi:23S rRNA U2552 (ribose-2'-O)-methylase RlmE/FtsJ